MPLSLTGHCATQSQLDLMKIPGVPTAFPFHAAFWSGAPMLLKHRHLPYLVTRSRAWICWAPSTPKASGTTGALKRWKWMRMRFWPWKLSSFSESMSNFWGMIFFDHGDLFVRSSIWTVLGLSWSLLCYTFPKTWLVTKPSAFTLVLGTFWWVVKRMFRSGQPQVGEMIKGTMRKNSPRAVLLRGRNRQRKCPDSEFIPFREIFETTLTWWTGQKPPQKAFRHSVLEMPYRFCRIFQVDDTSHQVWWKSSTWQYYFTPSKCSFVLRSRSGIPMTMCRQNPNWSPMARKGKDYRWCNLDLMRFQGLEQVPRKTVAT